MIHEYILKKSPIELIDTPITSHIYLCFCVWGVCVCEHLSSNPSKFQLYHTVLATIVTMFHIRFSNLIYLIAESLYPFTNLSLFPPLQALPTTFLLSVSVSLTLFFRFHI